MDDLFELRKVNDKKKRDEIVFIPPNWRDKNNNYTQTLYEIGRIGVERI